MSESRRIRVRFPRFGRRRNQPPPDARRNPARPGGRRRRARSGRGTRRFRSLPGGGVAGPRTGAHRRRAARSVRGGPAPGFRPPRPPAPSPGERRVESRFAAAAAAIRARADAALGRLDAERHRARARGSASKPAPSANGSASPRSPARCLRASASKRATRRRRPPRRNSPGSAGITASPTTARRASPAGGGRGLLVAVALAETTANGLLLHSASTEGVVASWTFAALITAMNVGLLGWLIGELIFRRMIVAGALRRAVLALALLPCLGIAALLHFGFRALPGRRLRPRRLARRPRAGPRRH